jgi:hypothetical protein
MSQSASQAAAFYKEVARNKKVWTVKDSRGFPAPRNGEGIRAQPFWSSLARVRKILKTVQAYSGFESYEISWEEFTSDWVPDLNRNGFLVGINWSGAKAVGFDLKPGQVKESVESYIGSE